MVEARLHLPPDPASVRRARVFTAEFLESAGLSDKPDIVLLVSELVTNAVLHAGSDIELVIGCVRGTVRVEVGDLSQVMPTLHDVDPWEPHWRGLALVDRLSKRWGAARVPDHGKRVWFEVRV